MLVLVAPAIDPVSASGIAFDLDVAGSRFTMRPAVAVRVGAKWMDRSEREKGVAQEAIDTELGEEWTADDPAVGEIRVLDGVQGRGAAAWVPVVEWLGPQVASGLVGQAALEGIRRIWRRISEARSRGYRVMVSQGLAVALAMLYVHEETEETDLLRVEFVREPSALAGRPVTEASYIAIEPWIVSLVDRSRTTRYLLAVSPEGDVEGCIATPVGTFEAMYSPLPAEE